MWSWGRDIIGDGTEIGQRDRVSITHMPAIGEIVFVYITDYDHAYEDINAVIIVQRIVDKHNFGSIDEHLYIGTNFIIVGNVYIGKYCVIGTNSVVMRDVPDYCMVVGSPAKVIRTYDFQTNR